jgi:hypothetical protein
MGQRIELSFTPNQLAADTQVVWLEFKGNKAFTPYPQKSPP